MMVSLKVIIYLFVHLHFLFKLFFISLIFIAFLFSLDSVFKEEGTDGIKDISIDCFGSKYSTVIVESVDHTTEFNTHLISISCRVRDA